MTKTFCDICGKVLTYKDNRYSVTMKYENKNDRYSVLMKPENAALVDEDNAAIRDRDFYLKDVCQDCREDIYNFIGDLQDNKQH